MKIDANNFDDQSQSDQGIAGDSPLKKTYRVRGCDTLKGIRQEIIKVYSEARAAGPVAETVSYFRMLAFILSTAAQVKKDESLEEIETRLKALEEMRNERISD